MNVQSKNTSSIAKETGKMQAITFEKYGPPEMLHTKTIEKPTPKPQEVLIKVQTTTVTSGDWRVRAGTPFAIRLVYGLTKPKISILGCEFAGIVVEVGTQVTQWKPGDKVFGYKSDLGTYAEYICLPEDGIIATQPANLTFEEATALPNGAMTALYFLRKANVQQGKKILIYGASGSVGTFAVQLANCLGANVTAVCSTKNLALVKSLGAHQVIDYTQQDFRKKHDTYDIIFDTVGKTRYRDCKPLLNINGCYVLTSYGVSHMWHMLKNKVLGGIKVICDVMKASQEDLLFLKKLVVQEKLKPVIDKTYAFEQLPAAHGYVEQGHKKGNVIVQVGEGQDQ